MIDSENRHNDGNDYIGNDYSGNDGIVMIIVPSVMRIYASHDDDDDDDDDDDCLLYTSPSPRDGLLSRMPSSA